MFPFLQTNITSHMWPSGGKGGWLHEGHDAISPQKSSKCSKTSGEPSLTTVIQRKLGQLNNKLL